MRWQYIVLPTIAGFGYAMIEVEVHAWLNYFTQSILHFLLQSYYVQLALNPDWRSVLYFLGMFIVLGVPWVVWRNFWAWLMSTTIAFWVEDASYWLLAWEPASLMGYPNAVGLLPSVPNLEPHTTRLLRIPSPRVAQLLHAH